MSHHEGVSCDSCARANFRGKRYKCLSCFDYDLCAACHDSGTLNGRHTAEHPMQCILTRNDLDLYFTGELIDQPHSFTCPFCGKLGLTDTSLFEHVNASHTDATTEVVCPICATLPGGEPNQITDDFLAHLNVEHRNNRELEEPQIVRIRSRHHPRGLNNNRSSNRRSQFLNPTAAGSSTSARDAIDPIAQLLSQLSDVRRVNSNNTSTSGQSGLMQFQFDRQAAATNRLPIERIIRRHQQQTSQLSSSMASAHVDSLTSQQLPYMVLLDSASSPVANASLHHKSSATTGGTPFNKIGTKFLLSSCAAPSPLVDSEKEKIGTLLADRSIFVEEIILATLAEPLDIVAIVSTQSTIDETKATSPTDAHSAKPDQSSTLEVQVAKGKEDGEYTESEVKEGSFVVDNLISDESHTATVDSNLNVKSEEEEESNKSMVSRKPSIKSQESNLNSINYGEHESVQQKPLPSFATSPNAPFIMSPAQLSHRARNQKGRAASSMASSGNLPPNLTSLAIRSSLTSRPGAAITVVSPTGRRKVHKHTTEPPPN